MNLFFCSGFTRRNYSNHRFILTKTMNDNKGSIFSTKT